MTNLNQDIIFSQQKDELVKLLDKAGSLTKELESSKVFPEEAEALKMSIETARKRCYENMFDILLVAPFQSGKSTTVNALADGREVSPRGLGGGGIKTSACIVKVQNIVEGEEKATIKWKRDEQLCYRIDDFLGPTLRKENPDLSQTYELSKSEVDQSKRLEYKQRYFDNIDFIKNHSVKIDLKNKLQSEVDKYNRDRSNYGRNKIDELRFALSIFNFFDNQDLINLKERKSFSLDEIQDIIRFPANFSKRWSNCDPNEFKATEIAYFFIEEILIEIKSESLKQTGMRIVDAPGLFVSAYDTEVTQREMQNASAIWYLLNGTRQLTDEDKRTLEEINKLNQAHKVFFGINFKTDPERISQGEIGESIVTELSDLGYDTSLIYYYNAFLALRVLQGQKLLDQGLDNRTKRIIIEDAQKYDSRKDSNIHDELDAWRKTTSRAMREINSESWQVIEDKGLSVDTIELVKDESRWLEVTEKIKGYVYHNKAFSFLVERGCSPIKKVLEEAKANLEILEIRAKQGEEEAEIEIKNARTQLEEFTNYSKRTIDQFIDDLWEPFLATNFWESVMVKLVDSPAKRAAKEIADEASLSGILGNTLIDKPINLLIGTANLTIKGINTLPFRKVKYIPKVTLLAERCRSIFLREFEAEFQMRTIGWFQGLRTNQEYQEKIFSKVTTVSELLQEKWEQLELGDNTYLQHLNQLIPTFKGDFKGDFEHHFTNDVQEQTQKIMQDRFVGLFIGYINGAVGGAGLGAGLVALDFVLPGIGAILGVVTFIVISVVHTLLKSKDEYISKLEEGLTQGVKHEISIQQPEIMKRLRDKLSLISNFYSIALSDSLGKMKERLDNRIKAAQDNLKMAREERQEVARKANGFRTNHIEPLTSEISRFADSVCQVWNSF